MNNSNNKNNCVFDKLVVVCGRKMLHSMRVLGLCSQPLVHQGTQKLVIKFQWLLRL